MSDKPKLSIIVVCFRMREQILNTVLSLAPDYQRGVASGDYEVILLENSSDEQLSDEDVQSLPGNVRYILRQESATSPVAAINEGFRLAKADFIGLMIDGAYLLTPGVLHYSLMAYSATPEAFVTVPTYHLGSQEQAVSTLNGYDIDVQRGLLGSASWVEDGYRLYKVGCFCPANPRGFFSSILESNCFFASRKAFEEVGFADETFQQAGGGSVNLDMTLKLGTRPNSTYFTLAGEGIFHQFHGGVTTKAGQEARVKEFNRELHDKWENKFHYFARNPVMIGSVGEYAQDFLQQSSAFMQRRFNVCHKQGWPVWEDEQSHDI